MVVCVIISLKYGRGFIMYDDDEVDIAAAMERRRAWVTDDDMKALGLERATGLKAVDDSGPESHLDQAKRMLREAAPMAAASLVRLAQNGESETVRLRASVEILNRVEQQGSAKDGREPWAEVYDQILTTQDVEKYANGRDGWKP
jgi:hypothetical protein